MATGLTFTQELVECLKLAAVVLEQALVRESNRGADASFVVWIGEGSHGLGLSDEFHAWASECVQCVSSADAGYAWYILRGEWYVELTNVV